MKATTIAILAIVSALSAPPLIAADAKAAPFSIEERLAEAEISVTIAQFEKVRALALDTELELELTAAAGSRAEEQAALNKRIGVLKEHAEKLRNSALVRGAELEERREVRMVKVAR